MKEKRYRCQRCSFVFVKQVFEPGEAKDKNLQSVPVTCPKCKSDRVKEY